MNRPFAILLYLTTALFYSCSPGRHYSPGKKFEKKVLQQDFMLMREILESKHPSIYWYTSPDSMNMYFDKYYGMIGDSMTEEQFAWKILNPVLDKIHCGHTTLRNSKAFVAWSKNRRLPSFPLHLKVWKDSMAVITSLVRKDSTFPRGTVITSINGIPAAEMKNIIFDHMPTDGYADNFNYIRLSSNFPYYHRNVFGISPSYLVSFIDSTGQAQTKELSVYRPNDSAVARSRKQEAKNTTTSVRPKKQQKLLRYRNLKIDSTGTFAVMTLNSFSKGRPSGFFRKSFRRLEKQGIDKLIIDLRVNGGGKIAASTLLTRYISRQPFRVADSMMAFSRSLGPYTRYANGKWLNNWAIASMSKKKADGRYHNKHYETKMYKPVRKNHFDGNVIVLISGPTFSASTLFCNAIKGQPGISLLGEETGGGWHGNNGVIIPDITLPYTKTRFRLPLFRVVQYKHVPKDGRGISPDIYVGPTLEWIKMGNDKKMETAVDLMRQADNKTVLNDQPPIRN